MRVLVTVRHLAFVVIIANNEYYIMFVNRIPMDIMLNYCTKLITSLTPTPNATKTYWLNGISWISCAEVLLHG